MTRFLSKSARLLTFGCASLALAAPAAAQTLGNNCAPREAIIQRLADSYGESRQSVALGANNTMVETYASLETGTWTIVVTTAGGPSCLVAAGQAFQLVSDSVAMVDPDI